MPSTKPHVNVRFEPEIYAKIVKRANAEGRSLANFVEQLVKREMASGEKQKRA